METVLHFRPNNLLNRITSVPPVLNMAVNMEAFKDVQGLSLGTHTSRKKL